MSDGNPIENILRSRTSLGPWIPDGVEVVGTFPAPDAMTALFNGEDEEFEDGTIVGFLVLKDPKGFSTVVGVVADEEGIHLCEDARNFVGYRRAES